MKGGWDKMVEGTGADMHTAVRISYTTVNCERLP